MLKLVGWFVGIGCAGFVALFVLAVVIGSLTAPARTEVEAAERTLRCAALLERRQLARQELEAVQAQMVKGNRAAEAYAETAVANLEAAGLAWTASKCGTSR